MKRLIEKHNGCAARDPYVIKYNNKYYRCFAEDSESVSLSCSDTIEGLKDAEWKKVYIPEPDKEYSKQLWAPELHIIDGKCYIYVACDDGNNHHHRMYVLENNSSDPMDHYVMHGKIADATDKWAIDGTVMKYNEENYFIWSGWEGDKNICQNLYIAKMKNPYELDSERVLISTPEYDWEKLGSSGREENPFINEGPFAFLYNGDCYVSYSAAGSWCKDYCIALLKLKGDNPLDPLSWEKLSEPVFSENELIMGGGHCSVVSEEDKLYVFFHAWDKSEKDIVWNTVSAWYGEIIFRDNGITIE